jgi:hypothetical protein
MFSRQSPIANPPAITRPVHAHPHWDFSASNSGVPPKHQAQQMHDGYNCKDDNCHDCEWLIHSVHLLEREKRGWAGIEPGRPTSHSQQAKPPGKLAEAA